MNEVLIGPKAVNEVAGADSEKKHQQIRFFGKSKSAKTESEELKTAGSKILNSDIKSAAMFIDFENLVFSLHYAHYPNPKDTAIIFLHNLINRLQRRGIDPIIRKAFFDFSTDSSGNCLANLVRHSIEPVHVLSIKKKNNADIRLSIELQKVVLTRNDIRNFVIVGGDSDYLTIANQIHENNCRLIIASTKESASESLIKSVGRDNFIEARILLGPPAQAIPGDSQDKGEVELDLFSKLPPLVVSKKVRDEFLKNLVQLALEIEVEDSNVQGIVLNSLLNNPNLVAYGEYLGKEGRKMLISDFRNQGIIKIEYRVNPMNNSRYKVVTLDKDHAVVAAIIKNLKRKSPGA